MWQLYVFSFIAGLFGANGVPNFVRGITGQQQQTPFGKPSSAVVNVIWGWVNFVIAFLFLYLGHAREHLLRALVLVGLGTLVMAILLANAWTKHPENNK